MSGRLLAADAEADAEEAIDALIAQRDQARGELIVLRTQLAMDAEHADAHNEKRSSSFWYAMWTEARRRNAEIALELARVRAALARYEP